MIILGIDPGLALMGYGIIEFERQKIKLIQYGCIETQAKSITERPADVSIDLIPLRNQGRGCK